MTNEEKVVFGIDDKKEVVILGIPEAGWRYMKNGMTHTFDLSRYGIPFKIVLFGGKDRASLLKMLNMDKDTLDVTGINHGFGGE